MTTTTPTVDLLRAWARGLYPLEAGVELLARSFCGGFVLATSPWVVWEDDCGERRCWVDADLVHAAATSGPYSGGERRVLRIVASLLSYEHPVSLGDVLPGLDRDHVQLVLAAVAHASGSHEHVSYHFPDQGGYRSERLSSLYAWPS